MRLGPDQLRPYKRVARTIQWGVVALSLLICGQARAQEASFLETLLKDNSNVMVVLDASGSMSEPWTDEATKFEAARAALIDATTGLPSTTRSGAVAFSHRRNFDCSDIEVLSNPSAVPAALARALNEETPQDRGMRPLADAIETAAARLSQQNGPGAIVVLTDGAEECGGNSCALSAPLAQMQIPVHLIGLGMDAADAALLRCLPASAGARLPSLKPARSWVRTSLKPYLCLTPPTRSAQRRLSPGSCCSSRIYPCGISSAFAGI